MLNNKGFAVSTVLYTLLIAFLLFLGATLAMFSTSTSVVGNANTDLTDGSKLEAKQVKVKVPGKDCMAVRKPENNRIPPSDAGKHYWYETGELTTDASGNNVIKDAVILRINSKYGTIYWPKDFGTVFDVTTGKISVNATSENGVTSVNGDGLDLKPSNITLPGGVVPQIDEEAGTTYKNIKVQCSVGNTYKNPNQCNINWDLATDTNPGRLDILRLRIVDTLTNEDYYVNLYDLCQ